MLACLRHTHTRPHSKPEHSILSSLHLVGAFLLACLLACLRHTHTPVLSRQLSLSFLIRNPTCLNIRFFLVYICQDRLGMDGAVKKKDT